MRWVKLMPATTFVLSLAWTWAAGQGAAAPRVRPKLDGIVKIEFPKDGYTFTLAEAAKGIKIEYKILVEEDCEGVIPLPDGPSFQAPPGPSGLYPREQISGKDHLYCLMDFGLGAPPKEVVKTLKKG